MVEVRWIGFIGRYLDVLLLSSRWVGVEDCLGRFPVNECPSIAWKKGGPKGVGGKFRCRRGGEKERKVIVLCLFGVKETFERVGKA